MTTTAHGWTIEPQTIAPATAFAKVQVRPRTMWVQQVTHPLLVLGSGQSEVVPLGVSVAGHEVVRRRTGGAAVWLDANLWWADVSITRNDVLWSDDVGHAFQWLGRVMAAAIGTLLDDASVCERDATAPRLRVHEGPLITTAWSRVVCFAGLGPGEVTADGRKLVGLSQRRTREGAVFQVGVLLRWEPATWCGLLHVPNGVLDDLAVGLEHLCGEAVPPSRVTAAVTRALDSVL